MHSVGRSNQIVSVRRADEGDLRGILACLRAAFEEYRDRYTPAGFTDTVLTPESLRERLRKMMVYVAVSTRARVVGTLAAAIVNGGEGHLRGMAVHPDFQSSGIATKLLERALNDLRTHACQRVTLDTTDVLLQAMRFYEARGFVRTGRVSDFFGMPLHEYAKLFPLDLTRS